MTWSNTARAVHEFIKRHELMNIGDKLLLAFSGGRDSMALLHLLKELQDYWQWTLIIGHINHGLRPGADEAESEFSCTIATESDADYLETTLTLDHSVSMESEARAQRYAILETWRQEKRADKILTGHHADDQAETILYRLFKGSGVRGMSGIQRKTGYIVRPMLCLTRNEIDAYVQKNVLSFCEDVSNQDERFARNAIRHSIMPAVAKYFPHTAHHLNELSHDFQQLNSFIDEYSTHFIEQHAIQKGKYRHVSRRVLMSENSLIQREILKQLAKVSRHFSRKELDQALSLIEKGQSGQRMMFAEDFHMYIDRIDCVFGPELPSIPLTELRAERPFWLANIGRLALTFHSGEISPKIPLDDTVHIMGNADNASIFEIRSWLAGDKMNPFGGGSVVNVSDLLTQAKIPAWLKPVWPVVLLNGEIIWIPGVRRGSHCPMNDSKKEFFSLIFRSETMEAL